MEGLGSNGLVTALDISGTRFLDHGLEESGFLAADWDDCVRWKQLGLRLRGQVLQVMVTPDWRSEVLPALSQRTLRAKQLVSDGQRDAQHGGQG